MRDVVVVGAGLAGLVAALRLAREGASVTLVSKGPGGLQLSQGTFDVLGYAPDRVVAPLAEVDAFGAAHPDHPYARLGADRVRAGLEFVREAAGADEWAGDGQFNLNLPTAVGAVRPTAMAPASMASSEIVEGGRYLVVGLRRFKDMTPALVAGNLARTDVVGGVEARSAWIDLEGRPGEQDVSALTFARELDRLEAFDRLADLLEGLAGPEETILLPAVLGLDDHRVAQKLSDKLGRRVGEVSCPPPGIPGLRLFRTLTRACEDAGVRFVRGSFVTAGRGANGRLEALVAAQAGRPVELAARAFVLAPGGFESGALSVDSYGAIMERILGLPLTASSTDGLIGPDFWGSDEALFTVGVPTDADLRPVDATGGAPWSNLRVAGGILPGALRWREKSGEGIAAASGLVAADSILKELR